MAGRGRGRGAPSKILRGNQSSAHCNNSSPSHVLSLSSPIPDTTIHPQAATPATTHDSPTRSCSIPATANPPSVPTTTIRPQAPTITNALTSPHGDIPSSQVPTTSVSEAPSPSNAFDSHLQDDAFENPEPPPSTDSLLRIKPFEKGNHIYTPNKPGANGILSVIKTTLKDPYPTWRSVPPAKRKELFQEWKKYVNYEPQYDDYMREAFEKHIKNRLPDIYSEIRKEGKKPSWMFPDTYDALCKHWESPEWKKKSEINKKNRASPTGGSLHAAGSISTATLYENHKKKTGTAPDDGVLFLLSKRRKADQLFLEPRGEQAWDNYMNLIKTHEAEATETGVPSTQQARNELFSQAIGGRNKKGRMYSMNYLLSASSSHMDSYSSGSNEHTSPHGQSYDQVDLQLNDLKQNQEKQRECQEKQTESIQRIEEMLSGFMRLVGGLPLMTTQSQHSNLNTNQPTNDGSNNEDEEDN